MKKTYNTLAFLLVMFLVQANAKQIISPVIPTYAEGSILIFAEGLTDEPIEMAFYQHSSKTTLQVEIRIYKASTNQLLYSAVRNTNRIRIDDFVADAGSYLLEITLNGETCSVVF